MVPLLLALLGVSATAALAWRGWRRRCGAGRLDDARPTVTVTPFDGPGQRFLASIEVDNPSATPVLVSARLTEWGRLGRLVTEPLAVRAPVRRSTVLAADTVILGAVAAWGARRWQVPMTPTPRARAARVEVEIAPGPRPARLYSYKVPASAWSSPGAARREPGQQEVLSDT